MTEFFTEGKQGVSITGQYCDVPIQVESGEGQTFRQK